MILYYRYLLPEDDLQAADRPVFIYSKAVPRARDFSTGSINPVIYNDFRA